MFAEYKLLNFNFSLRKNAQFWRKSGYPVVWSYFLIDKRKHSRYPYNQILQTKLGAKHGINFSLQVRKIYFLTLGLVSEGPSIPIVAQKIPNLAKFGVNHKQN